jgi:hypothetical protein
MTRLLPIFSLLLIAATPVEAHRPTYGTYLKSPPHWRHPRFEMSDYIVYTPRGWQRSRVYDLAARVAVCNYVFGQVRYSLPRDEPETGDVW